MITRETSIHIGKRYQILFCVYDDKEWFVTINNLEEEFGASSDECSMNWDKGLAEAFVNIATMMSDEAAEDLMYELIMVENIDNHFTKYLPEPYNIPCYGCPHKEGCWETPGTCIGG